jgi:hypothetical protein
MYLPLRVSFSLKYHRFLSDLHGTLHHLICGLFFRRPRKLVMLAELQAWPTLHFSLRSPFEAGTRVQVTWKEIFTLTIEDHFSHLLSCNMSLDVPHIRPLFDPGSDTLPLNSSQSPMVVVA